MMRTAIKKDRRIYLIHNKIKMREIWEINMKVAAAKKASWSWMTMNLIFKLSHYSYTSLNSQKTFSSLICSCHNKVKHFPIKDCKFSWVSKNSKCIKKIKLKIIKAEILIAIIKNKTIMSSKNLKKIHFLKL